MAELRVLVLADDPYAREGLAALLSQVPGVAASETGAADVAVWDEGADAPDLDAEDAPFFSGPPVVALVPDGARAARVLAAGARGALLRGVEPARLASALAAAASGWTVLDERITRALLAPRAREAAEPHEELTPRELEALDLLARGLSNREIARRLGVSEHTAKFHVTSILAKLGAQSRAEAIVKAARLGLVVL